MDKIAALWALIIGLTGGPTMISYGPLPQKIAIYPMNVASIDFWDGPRTLDPTDLSYVRGDKRFHNPSNYGLLGLPDLPQKWAKRRLHFDQSCNQPGPLTSQQLLAYRLIEQTAQPLPNGAITWRYDFALNYLKMVYQQGFNSAFSQAVNVAALLFAECKTTDHTYLDLATKGALGLITPISDGGVMNPDDGLTFFEELPAPPGLSPYILNADLLSINVLFAIAKRTGDYRFSLAARKGVDTLLKLIPRYDAPKCIRYALEQIDECHPDYDEYEAVLFDDMAEWANDPLFHEIADHWRSRLPSSSTASR